MLRATLERRKTDRLSRRGAEWLGALAACTWGAWLLVPGWQPLTMCDHTYDVMLVLAREEVWGVIFLAAGLVKCVALRWDDARGRKISALAIGGLWSYVAISVGLAHFSAPAFPLYAFIALQMFRISMRIRTRDDPHAP